MMFRRFALLAALLTLAACAVSPPVSTPLPQPLPEPVPQSMPVLPPPEPAPLPQAPTARPVNPALQSLVAQAEQRQRQGDAATAASLLERAIRIAPRDPAGYEALSQLRWQQGRMQEAEQLALRALALPQLTAEEKQRLWQRVADCRQARGDETGADSARQRAAS